MSSTSKPPPKPPPPYEPDKSLSIDEAINRLGTGRFQRVVLLAAGLCFCADAMEITLLSFLSAILKVEWDLTTTQAASITGSVFAGQLVGTVVLGRLGDLYGRRPIFLVSACAISFFGIATAFATSYATLLATRTAVGFGVGGLVVPFDILAEFLPPDTRGRYLLYVEYFWTIGSMSVPILARLTYGRSDGTGTWNGFVLLCALPCLASAAVGGWFVPESPRWLLSRGRGDEAMQVLRRAADANGLDPSVVFPSNVSLRDEGRDRDGSGGEKGEGGVMELFGPKWRRLTLLIWGTWIGFAYGYYGTILVVTRVFQEGGGAEANDDDAVAAAAVSFDYASIFISCSAELVGTTLVIVLVDRCGRVAPQVASYLLGGALVLLLSLTSGGGAGEGGGLEQRSPSHRAFLTSVAFGARIFEMAATCTTWVSTAEILPTEIRTTGHSAANAVARLSALACPFLVEGDASLPVVGVVMFAIHVFTAACASRLPETRGLEMGEVVGGKAEGGGRSCCRLCCGGVGCGSVCTDPVSPSSSLSYGSLELRRGHDGRVKDSSGGGYHLASEDRVGHLHST